MQKKTRKLKTIRLKLLVPILLVTILGSLFMGVMSYRYASDVIITAAKGDGMRAAQSLREFMDLIISTAELDISAIAMQPQVERLILLDAPPEEIELYMASLIERHPIYNSMIVLNGDGIIVASTSGSTGGDRADREYFKESMAGNNFISEVEVSRQTGNLASFISMPIRMRETGEIIGVAMAAVKIDEINTKYVAKATLLGGYGYAMIVNKEGKIIGHLDNELLGEEIPEELLKLLYSVNEERVVFEEVVDGIDSMLFIERSHTTDWIPIVICPLSDFYISANALARVDAMLTVLVIIISTIVVYVAIHGITQSLSKTIRYAKMVSQGDLDAELLLNREDEVGILANSLRKMVGKLKQMIDVAEQKTRDAEEARETMLSSINYASKIQKNLLPRDSTFESAFSDYAVIWKPRDIVGGDIYWMKQFDQGTVLCVCDCTGHGTPGALLTMLVVSALEAIIRPDNCHDPADIIYQLDHRLSAVLHVDKDIEVKNSMIDIDDGCDSAVLFIANDGSITMSAGNSHVFICDGKEVSQYKGQKIFIGEGKVDNKEEVIKHHIPASPQHKFYIASDGLFDQIGGKRNKQFGYKRFKKIILENHGEKQVVISQKIWEAFEEYRGNEDRRDDFELVTFMPKVM